MKCNQCHEEVDPIQWKFCPHCGDTLVDEKIIYLFFKFLKQRKVLYSLLLFEIIFIGLIAFLLVRSSLEIRSKNLQMAQLINSRKNVTLDWKINEKILPISYVGENQKMVQFQVSSENYTNLRVEVAVDGLTSNQTKIISIKPGGNMFTMGPDITDEGFQKLKQSHKFPVAIKVADIGIDQNQNKVLLDDQKEVMFYSVEDMIWNDKGSDNANYVVRLIDKDKPEIKSLVRKAADHMKEVGGKSNAMVGQLADNTEVIQQMQAIFLAMEKDYKIRYVLAPYSYDSNEIQKIKTPAEVINQQSGLCIELAMTMAAALENVGLNPVIIITQDHAWPGVKLNAADEKFAFIETTMLDSSPQAAMNTATMNWEKINKNMASYKIIRVTDLRSDGILPIVSY